MQSIARLDDRALLSSLHTLVRGHRAAISGIVAHLGEVEARRLYAVRGHSSLFVYCVKELAFSEDEACRRIEAARMARRSPRVLTMLEEGTVSLSVLGLLKHRIEGENADELLSGVARKSVQSAKEWLAARFPAPDVPEEIRKLPSTAGRHSGGGLSTEKAAPATRCDNPDQPPNAALTETVDVPATAQTTPASRPVLGESVSRPPRVEPLSADRFSVKLTVSRQVREKLERARGLARHRLPSGNLEELLELALDALLEKMERARLGKVQRPRKPVAPRADDYRSEPAKTQPRTPPRHVRREVVARDGDRCSYVSEDGTRCDCRAFLEFDHIEPAALGGETTTRNLRLRCRAHNALEAERVYGREFIARAIAERREKRQRTTPPAT